MEFQKKLSDQLVLHYVEDLGTDNKGHLLKARFYFSFYGKGYSADISKKYVDEDWTGCEAEGDSDLFDSFVSAIEDDYWEEMKGFFSAYEADFNKEVDENN